MALDDLDAILDGPPSSTAEGKRPLTRERQTILVIDDDASIRRSLEFLLTPHYDTVLCASAREGLAAVNDEISAVILDVKMQGHDGFWACDQIRKLQPDIPVIFFSAYQDVKDPFQIMNQHRPFAYIRKDDDPRKLLDAIETATRLYQTTVRSKRLLAKLKRSRSAAP